MSAPYVLEIFLESTGKWVPQLECATAESAMKAIAVIRKQSAGSINGIWFDGARCRVTPMAQYEARRCR